MERYFDNRGNYNVAYYAVPIDERMRSTALNFAKRIILSDNQYSRLLPTEVRNSKDVTMQHKIEIQRTYMGKLGEIAFLKFLNENNKKVNINVTRPPKVRPKKSNFGGRYFYVKIQL